MKRKYAFTLMEMLVVIAVIAILAALLFPAISAAKARAKRMACLNNLRQISLGMRMYADDHHDTLPNTPSTNSPLHWYGYKALMKSYVGINSVPSSQDRVFACPNDTFYYDMAGSFQRVPKGLHEQPPDYLSYAFNGGNARTNSNAPGIAGRLLSSIKDPTKSILVAESPAFIPYSWHEPKPPVPNGAPMFEDAKNVVGFVDGHVSYIKMYWGGNNPPGSLALHHDPPVGYAYKWSGD